MTDSLMAIRRCSPGEISCSRVPTPEYLYRKRTSFYDTGSGPAENAWIEVSLFVPQQRFADPLLNIPFDLSQLIREASNSLDVSVETV